MLLTEAGYYLRVETDIQTETSVKERSGLYFHYNQIRKEWWQR